MKEKKVLLFLKTQKWIIAVIGCFLLLLVLMVANRQSRAAVEQLPITRGPTQVVRFTVYDAGIFPTEARVKPGSVLIRAEDLTGTAETLLVQTQNRQVIGQIVRGESQWRGSARLTLTTGVYQVCDVGQITKCASLNVE